MILNTHMITENSFASYYKPEEFFSSISCLPSELLVIIYEMLGRSDFVLFIEKNAYRYAKEEHKSTLRLARAIYYRNLERQFQSDSYITELFYKNCKPQDLATIPQFSGDSCPATRQEILAHRVMAHMQNVSTSFERSWDTLAEMPHAAAGSLAKIIIQRDIDAIDHCLERITPPPHARNGYVEFMRTSEERVESPFLFMQADFSNIGLCHLPAKVCQFTSIVELKLVNNRLHSLPSEIGAFPFLTLLDLSHNCLKRLPSEVGMLGCLETLDLFDNQLEELPDTMTHLTHMKDFNISKNQLKKLPDWIGNWVDLISLYLGSNQISFLPTTFWKLKKIIILDISENVLTTLPKEIEKLTALHIIRLGRNHLISIPKELANLPHLFEIELGYNFITTCPPEITQLQVHLEGNPLTLSFRISRLWQNLVASMSSGSLQSFLL